MGHWASAVEGLQGKASDVETMGNAMAFLMRLEEDAFYSSPEQVRGGAKDSQSLVYSLCLLLFERLTGHHPFVESLSPLECRIQRDKSKRVGENNLCHIPQSLRVILAIGLSPFSEDRFADVSTLRSEMLAWMMTQVPEPATSSAVVSAIPVLKVPVANEQNGVQSTSSVRETALAPNRGSSPPPLPIPQKTPAPVYRVEDTLEGAVVVSEVQSAKDPPSRPWLWTALSGGFAVVSMAAVLMIFVAKKNLKSSTGQAKVAAMGSQKNYPVSRSEKAVQPPSALPMEAATLPAEAKTVPAPQEQLIAVLRDCIPESQLRSGMHLGITLVYDAEGNTRKTYSGRLPLNPEQSSCVKKGLLTIETHDPSDFGKMVGFTIHISSKTHRIRKTKP